jgi:hypothetical protein
MQLEGNANNSVALNRLLAADALVCLSKTMHEKRSEESECHPASAH